MVMPDYSLIGKRIRKRRASLELTQEKLAEAAGIGIQHMSKIETGNTKLSLPCLINIANALEVTVDTLLLDNMIASRPDMIREAESGILADCTPAEAYIVTETVSALKKSLRKAGAHTDSEG